MNRHYDGTNNCGLIAMNEATIITKLIYFSDPCLYTPKADGFYKHTD